MKLYKTFEELWLHTANDKLAEAVECFAEDFDGEDTYEYSIIYAYFQAYLMGYEVKPENVSKRTYSWAVFPIFQAINRSERSEATIVINNLMHIMHNMCREITGEDLRGLAMEQLYDVLFREFGVRGGYAEAYPQYEGIHLDGKDCVPEEWCAVIRDALKKYDVGVTIKMTWCYSHLDCGSGYRYDQDESIWVMIYAEDQKTADAAAKTVNTLPTFVWKS